MVRLVERVPLLTGTLCSHAFERRRHEMPCAAREVGEQRPYERKTTETDAALSVQISRTQRVGAHL
jgi:hypothetical protein